MKPTAQTSRRTILRNTAALLSLAALPRALVAGEKRRRPRTVVWLHLRGGNDGLNTVVPLGDRRYRRLRPTLAVSDGDALRLGKTSFGLHPSMKGMADLYETGRLAVVHGVGWPQPSLSHFRMTEIWHAGRSEARDGWVGRMLAQDGARGLGAVALDREPPLLLHGAPGRTVTFREPKDLRLPDDLGDVRLLYESGRLRTGALGRVARRGKAALDTASRLSRLEPANLGRADEPAKTLGLALTLLESFPDLKAIHVAHDGYDTHANQATAHAGLLASFSDAVTAFQREVEKRDLASRVLLVAWSEFGRRPAENASAGTDHGTAGPLFLVGRGLRGGLHGEPPDLGDLSHDNLRATTDLRRVSAEVIARAWGLDPLPILGSHAPLEILS